MKLETSRNIDFLPYLAFIFNLEDIVVFKGLKMFDSDNSLCLPAVEMRLLLV